jgi:hypothetical protein
MSQRFKRTLALATLCLAVPIPPVAAGGQTGSSTGQAPLVWSGRILDRHGQPSAAHVTAFLRPPASAIPAAGAGTHAPASIPLASGVAGPEGEFELRAGLPAVPVEYRPDGWLHVMCLPKHPTAPGPWRMTRCATSLRVRGCAAASGCRRWRQKNA